MGWCLDFRTSEMEVSGFVPGVREEIRFRCEWTRVGDPGRAFVCLGWFSVGWFGLPLVSAWSGGWFGGLVVW